MKAILMTAAGSTDVLQLREIANARTALAASPAREAGCRRRESARHQAARQAGLLSGQAARDTRLRRRRHRRGNRQRGDAFQGRRCGVFLQRRLGNQATSRAAMPNTPRCTKTTARRSPPTISLQDSAALPLVLITAWEALVERAQSAGRADHPDPRCSGRRGTHRGAARPPPRRAHRGDGRRRQEGRAGTWPVCGKDHQLPRTGFRGARHCDWTDGKGADVVFDTSAARPFCAR